MFGDALVQGGPDQIGLRREAAVKGSFTNSGAAGHGFHGGVRTQLAVHLARCAQYALNVAGRVRPQWPVGNCRHWDSLANS